MQSPAQSNSNNSGAVNQELGTIKLVFKAGTVSDTGDEECSGAPEASVTTKEAKVS